MLRFLRTLDGTKVSDYPLLAIDRAMQDAGIPPLSLPQAPLTTFAAKALSRLRVPRNVRRSRKGAVFVAFMGFSESKTLPLSCWTELIPYCFDCWPAGYGRWTSFFRRHRVRLAFFSARQSAEYFSRTLPRMRSYWMPEATDPDEYSPSAPLARRDIDVLELGRKNDTFHDRIAPPLAQRGHSHLFERIKGEIIFPTRRGLIDGLGRTTISVCFPCSQTHPERSGTVETVTHRYFQSMASRCVVLGHAPQELVDMFGYNPVIEVQQGNELQQVLHVLEHPDRFQELVDRNYRRVLEVGSWTIRVQSMLAVIRTQG
jgi:hypothetical protein